MDFVLFSFALLFFIRWGGGWKKGSLQDKGQLSVKKTGGRDPELAFPCPHVSLPSSSYLSTRIFSFSHFIWALCLFSCLFRSWALFAEPLLIFILPGIFSVTPLGFLGEFQVVRSNMGCKGKYIAMICELARATCSFYHLPPRLAEPLSPGLTLGLSPRASVGQGTLTNKQATGFLKFKTDAANQLA